jgi:hypothetical protein
MQLQNHQPVKETKLPLPLNVPQYKHGSCAVGTKFNFVVRILLMRIIAHKRELSGWPCSADFVDENSP